METILGDQSPWNGGLLRAHALRSSGVSFIYQHQDADMPGVNTGGPTGISRGNPPYFSLACRLPLSLHDSTERQKVVINTCRGASARPVVYVQYGGGQTIKGHDTGREIEQMFRCEREHLCAVSGKDLPSVTSIERALELHADGVKINSLVEMFHEAQPLLLNRLDETHFWGINETFRRVLYVRGKDYYAIVPKASALLLEFTARGLRFGVSNCPYRDEVVRLRDSKLRGMKVSVLRIKFSWNADFLGEHTGVGKAWRKKGEPDFSSIIDFWSERPTSMGVLAFGGRVNHTLEEHEW